MQIGFKNSATQKKYYIRAINPNTIGIMSFHLYYSFKSQSWIIICEKFPESTMILFLMTEKFAYKFAIFINMERVFMILSPNKIIPKTQTF